MPLFNKELSILPDDIIFNHAGLTLVMSLRDEDDDDIRAYVGVSDNGKNKSSFYWAFDKVSMKDDMKQWIKDRGFIEIMNREIQAVYGSFSDNAELQLWEKFARFCKGNLSFDSKKGFQLA